MNSLNGVNLGGWLVLEKWLTPRLFSDIKSQDEYSFCQELGILESFKRLTKHRQTFITQKDFAWTKKSGLNSVRIPVGYWIFGDEPPFIGAIEYLDKAFVWAKQYDLKILLDLHAGPGSQNGWDHSGLAGKINWHKDELHQKKTLEVLEKLVWRYKDHPSLWGIELLNEPHWEIPLSILKKFYQEGYDRVRTITGDKLAIVFHDGFRPFDWLGVFPKKRYQNIYLDRHLYQCFSDEDKNLDMPGHIQKVADEWRNVIKNIQKEVPIIIGEWSLGIDHLSVKGLTESEVKHAKLVYKEAQEIIFENAYGWFFWTYKVEDPKMRTDWDFRKNSKNFT